MADTQTGRGSPEVWALAGPAGDIEIRHDLWGIPHVLARSEADAFFGNGWVHAADRLWQMDAARRRAVGRYAEWVGQEGLASDVLMRRLGVERVSRADYEALAPETRAMCQAYSDGVNAFIAAGNLPPEYSLLAAPPEPWEPWHCVAVMRQRGLLMGSIWFKLWRAAAYGRIGAANLALLRYEDGGIERFVAPQDRQDSRWTATLRDLAPSVEALALLFDQDATGGGSNNWAVNARHTTTGMPLLAGDPHRAYEIPSMYTQIHLRCDSFDVLGFAVPGVPGTPHFGHNEHVAWGVTHAFADIHDIYVEDFQGLAPGHYRTPDGSRAATHRRETVLVRGAADVEVDIWETRHGPLIVGSPEAGAGLALKSVQLQAGDLSLDCLRPMLSARSVTGFHDVMGPWGLIDHNLVAADRNDTIGVQVRARVPDRDRMNGWLPVPGWTDAHEWRGMIPFERMPREENPASGILVTANNRTVPEDWPDYICTDCHPSTRANRIHRLLSENGPFAADDMAALLHDHSSAVAAEFAARILDAVPEGGAAGSLVAALRGWTGSMAPTALAPTVYYEVRQEMTRVLSRISGLDGVSGTEIAALPPGISPHVHLWWALPDQLRRDDTSLLGGADWTSVIVEAAETVAARFSPRPWGAAHQPRFVHPLAATFPGAGLAGPTSAQVGGDGDCVLATGALPATGTTSTYGPVAKYIWDLSDWDNCSWVLFHGASGNPESPHYSDQNTHWARSELVPAFYSEARIDANLARKVVLRPQA